MKPKCLRHVNIGYDDKHRHVCIEQSVVHLLMKQKVPGSFIFTDLPTSYYVILFEFCFFRVRFQFYCTWHLMQSLRYEKNKNANRKEVTVEIKRKGKKSKDETKSELIRSLLCSEVSENEELACRANNQTEYEEAI